MLEDLHWADAATLDVLRLLVRRIDGLPVLVVATYRDDEPRARHPLRWRSATCRSPRSSGSRWRRSRSRRSRLAWPADVDAAELHRRTAGNPFYVSEVLAAGGAARSPTRVRDAVLARAARLDQDARTLLEAVAIEPSRMELWLLEALVGGEPGGLEACLASGMLRAERERRHLPPRDRPRRDRGGPPAPSPPGSRAGRSSR